MSTHLPHLPPGRRSPGRPVTANRLLLAGAMLALLTACQPPVSLDDDVAPSAGDGAVYAAFGDSYSAGEGTNSYLPGTDAPGTNVCHRSTVAYSQLLATGLNVVSDGFVACSGAVTADMFHPNNNKNQEPDGSLEPAQLCQLDAEHGVDACGSSRKPVLGPATKLVTLTIGGNDAGLAKVVQTCVFGDAGRYRIGLPGRGCRDDPTTINRTLRRIKALAGEGSDSSPYGSQIYPLTTVLEAIHATAPDAHVYIAGYPKVFQPTLKEDCVVGSATSKATTFPLKVAAADAQALDHAAELLNAAVLAATRAAGSWATYVDVTTTFAGHGLCGASSWINPVAATVTLDSQGRTLSLAPSSGSLHPTREGQQGGYETGFLAAGMSAPR
ncbi:MAG: SGNH/GDSL hydrolase family protein [Janthinobacterium lividum]